MPRDKAVQNLKSISIPVALLDSIKHLSLQDLSKDLQSKLRNAGSHATRPNLEAAMMLDKVPAPFRTSVESVKNWLEGKEASHIISRYNGGSENPINLLWEKQVRNRLRGSKNMTRTEQLAIITEGYVGALGKAAVDGLRSAPTGAAIAVVTAMPITFLRYSFAVAKGEMTKEEATQVALHDVATQGVIGGISTAVVVAICSLCPPVAAALILVSPALLSVGVAGMLTEYYAVIYENREIVSSWLSKSKDKLDQVTESVNKIRSSISDQKVELKEEQEVINQFRTLQIKAQFGLKFWLQWVFSTCMIAVLSLVGVMNLAGNDIDQGVAGLAWILCMGSLIGFAQWLLIRLRANINVIFLFFNIAVVLVSLLISLSLLSANGWLSLATFLSCTVAFTVLSINRLLPKLTIIV